MSCKNEKPASPASVTGSLNLHFTYNFDDAGIVPDSLNYTCAAGYKMSVSRLQYYISGIRLYHADGGFIQKDEVLFLDINRNDKYRFSLSGVPKGDYSAISFHIGLDSSHNRSGSLPANYDNLGMEWPSAMGGGYHFVKLEGNFRDSTGLYGYAVHLGTNASLVTIYKIAKSFSISDSPSEVLLTMNIAEWFKNPFVYDFNKDGNYTMTDSKAMEKIAINGRDVFK